MRIDLRNMARLAPQVVTRPRWLYHYWRDGMPFEISNTRPVDGGEALPISAMGRTDLSHSPTWDDIEWIRANWEGPMVVKGVMGAEDARRAVDAGADGIVISNHGGRQLEGAPATIDVLPEIVAEVGGDTTILLDSGVRRANDVARAVALGADAVLIGRMSVYGLALGGEAGVTRMLDLLHQELVQDAPAARRPVHPRPRPELHRRHLARAGRADAEHTLRPSCPPSPRTWTSSRTSRTRSSPTVRRQTPRSLGAPSWPASTGCPCPATPARARAPRRARPHGWAPHRAEPAGRVTSLNTQRHADVVVVGGGNAGDCAAHAAAGRGRNVVILEKAPLAEAGGNSYYTAGATRIDHAGLADLLDLVEPDERHVVTEVPPYSPADYAADLVEVTGGRNDPDLTAVLVSEAQATVRWLQRLGVRYRLMYERQAYARPDGTFLFWGGLHIGNVGGGEGLMADHVAVARAPRDPRRPRVRGERTDRRRRTGRRGDRHRPRRTGRVARRLGGARRRRLRGRPGGAPSAPRHRLGARQGAGHTAQHRRDARRRTAHRRSKGRRLGERAQRAVGRVVRAQREQPPADQSVDPAELSAGDHRQPRRQRFVDEGADFRNYTYAKYGRLILEQPGSVAFQLFDARLRPLLRAEEYDMPGVSVAVADTIAGLAEQIGVDPTRLSATVVAYNASIDTTRPFDPTIKDGRRADVVPPKSNWASPLDTPPFHAYAVTCGITFTFGGLRGDTDGRVLDDHGRPIPGLFVCGEMLGGLFSDNYPGGTGLAAGMVFGRRAGAVA